MLHPLRAQKHPQRLLQRIGKLLHGVDRHVLLGPLQLAYIRPVHVRLRCELFLGPAAFSPSRP